MLDFVIVEDDPMVSYISSQYLQRIGGFRQLALFTNGKAALEYLRENPADLLILDVYMPGMTGLDLLRAIRAENIPTDVIMVTAATGRSMVMEALRLGIEDYLIKPFSFERFRQAITKYAQKRNLLGDQTDLDQDLLDKLLTSHISGTDSFQNLPKGMNAKTLDCIWKVLLDAPQEERTCEFISGRTSLSRVTIRHYLNYLLEAGKIHSTIDYETGGRPGVKYYISKE